MYIASLRLKLGEGLSKEGRAAHVAERGLVPLSTWGFDYDVTKYTFRKRNT